MMTQKQKQQKTMADFRNGVAATIEAHGMLAHGDRVLVAVSGGPDSVALLLMLIEQAPHYDLVLGIAHLNHGLRGESSDREAEFVLQLARQYELPFHTKKIKLDANAGSLEERARDQRYAFFRNVLAHHHYTKIALGHQADDNAEAFLMNLLRGSGGLGLAGIPPVRDGLYIRPLIRARRTDIITYLKDRRQAYMQDLSNTDMRFDRNRIRHALIPSLEKDYNPEIVSILNRTAALRSDEEAWFTDFLSPLTDSMVHTMTNETLVLSKSALCAQPPVIRRRLLRHALRQWQGHIRRIGAAHIERLSSMAASSGRQRHYLPNNVIAVSDGDKLRFQRGFLPAPPLAYAYAVNPDDSELVSISIPAAACHITLERVTQIDYLKLREKNDDCAWFDRDQLTFPLVVRNFRHGDRFQPFGMQGSQKIKKLFIDKKIDPLRRRTMPLLLCGNTIIWIPGIRRSACALVTENTKTALKVTIERNTQVPEYAPDRR